MLKTEILSHDVKGSMAMIQAINTEIKVKVKKHKVQTWMNIPTSSASLRMINIIFSDLSTWRSLGIVPKSPSYMKY